MATLLPRFRKCKILAARLSSAELAQWVTWELDGYPDDQPVPPYRELSGQFYANFMNAALARREAAVPLACPWQGSVRKL